MFPHLCLPHVFSTCLPSPLRPVKADSEDAMMKAVAQQPVAVAIDGDDMVLLGVAVHMVAKSPTVKDTLW